MLRVCVRVFGGGKFNYSCSNLEVMRSTLLVLVVVRVNLCWQLCGLELLDILRWVVWGWYIVCVCSWCWAVWINLVYWGCWLLLSECLSGYLSLYIKSWVQYFPFVCVWIVVVSYENICFPLCEWYYCEFGFVCGDLLFIFEYVNLFCVRMIMQWGWWCTTPPTWHIPAWALSSSNGGSPNIPDDRGQ